MMTIEGGQKDVHLRRASIKEKKKLSSILYASTAQRLLIRTVKCLMLNKRHLMPTNKKIKK